MAAPSFKKVKKQIIGKKRNAEEDILNVLEQAATEDNTSTSDLGTRESKVRELEKER